MTKPIQDPVALDTRGAAQRYSLSVSLLEHLRLTPGQGPRYIKVGRKVLYRVADLDAWMDERMTSTSAAASPRAQRDGAAG